MAQGIRGVLTFKVKGENTVRLKESKAPGKGVQVHPVTTVHSAVSFTGNKHSKPLQKCWLSIGLFLQLAEGVIKLIGFEDMRLIIMRLTKFRRPASV